MVGEGTGVVSEVLWAIGGAAVTDSEARGIDSLVVAVGSVGVIDLASRNGLEGGVLISELLSIITSLLQATSNKSNRDNTAKIECRIKASTMCTSRKTRQVIRNFSIGNQKGNLFLDFSSAGATLPILFWGDTSVAIILHEIQY